MRQFVKIDEVLNLSKNAGGAITIVPPVMLPIEDIAKIESISPAEMAAKYKPFTDVVCRITFYAHTKPSPNGDIKLVTEYKLAAGSPEKVLSAANIYPQ